ncbi:MAG: lysophospholipid acyltransferase family protein [Myxococcota bacterium]
MILRILSGFFCLLPERLAFALGRAVGWVWFHLLPVRRAVAVRNLHRALGAERSPGELRRIAAESFQHQALFGVELLRFPLMNVAESERLVERKDYHHLQNAVDEGRGVVAIFSHVGNFDLAGVSQALRGLPLAVVVKDIGWKPGHDFIFGQRQGAGIQTIRAKRSEREILRALRAGKVVAFVIDQHMPPHRGIATEFFGMLASTTPAPVLFAQRTGAPIVTSHIRRNGLGPTHVYEVDPPMILEEPFEDRKANQRHNTERLNRWLEGVIRRSPEQWLWMHKRWKIEDDPSGFDVPEDLAASWRARQKPSGA